MISIQRKIHQESAFSGRVLCSIPGHQGLSQFGSLAHCWSLFRPSDTGVVVVLGINFPHILR